MEEVTERLLDEKKLMKKLEMDETEIKDIGCHRSSFPN